MTRDHNQYGADHDDLGAPPEAEGETLQELYRAAFDALDPAAGPDRYAHLACAALAQRLADLGAEGPDAEDTTWVSLREYHESMAVSLDNEAVWRAVHG